jgi:hypothetical protein
LLTIPSHPRICHLGFLDDPDKFDAMAAAELLIMPSRFESLSMVALEAWALGRPVLANARCDVLKGQCIRSNGGLYYDGMLEFVETLRAIEQNRWLAGTLGKSGRQFFREHYDWAVIERKYLDVFDRLSKGSPARPLEPLPGWLHRRRQTCPAAANVVAALPAGPSVSSSAVPALVSRDSEPAQSREATREPPPRTPPQPEIGRAAGSRTPHQSRRGPQRYARSSRSAPPGRRR